MPDIVNSERGGRVFPTVASHQHAVARMYRGSAALYVGVGSLVVVLFGNVLGGAGVAHKVAVLGAFLLQQSQRSDSDRP